jgi:hypothetical protein
MNRPDAYQAPISGAIAAVDERDQRDRFYRDAEPYIQWALNRSWLAIEAEIRFPFASDEYRADWVDVNAGPDPRPLGLHGGAR